MPLNGPQRCGLRGSYFDLHNFRSASGVPPGSQLTATPLRRVYDLRHAFATSALRAGISTFDLSRSMAPA